MIEFKRKDFTELSIKQKLPLAKKGASFTSSCGTMANYKSTDAQLNSRER